MGIKWTVHIGKKRKRAHLQEFCQLRKDIEVEPELVAAVVWLPMPPFSEAAAVFGEDQHDAVIADSKVVQPADAWDVAEALHDSNLPECSHLYGQTTMTVIGCGYMTGNQTRIESWPLTA